VSYLYDICRASLVCVSEEQILAVADELLEEDETNPWRVLRCKNRFRNPTPAGFRDLNMNLVLPCG
jgi:hypothetical protein